MNGQSRQHMGFWTATGIVVANTIGTGVFTSAGFQAEAVPSVFAILMLWIVGGVIAMAGALCYAELGAAMPRSGGEYHYLSRLFHPSVGFLSGWVSGTVAFAAPIALAAMALGNYVSSAFPGIPPQHLAAAALLLTAASHFAGLKPGDWFQNLSTAFKFVPILILIAVGLVTGKGTAPAILPSSSEIHRLWHPAFAVSLIYVSYAYSGWNASTYVAGEVKDPRSTVPKSIILGTSAVMVVYLLLNYVFLRTVPLDEMKGVVEVGMLSAQKIFGPAGQKIIALLVGLGLLSSISSMMLAGSRVLKTMGEDFPRLKTFSGKSGNPRSAIVFQTAVALGLLWTSTFDQVLTYIGFTLSLFTTLAAAGVYVLRKKFPDAEGYKTWGYPITPALFMAFNIYMIVFVAKEKPVESSAGLATVLCGLGVYFLLERKPDDATSPFPAPQNSIP